MRIGITGSRSINDRDFIIECFDSIIENNEPPLVFITGGASGVDMIAEEYLKQKGFDVVTLNPADYYVDSIPYTPLFYRARNYQIVYNSDLLVAIWNGNERSGTKMTINKAERIGLEIVKFLY